MTDFGAENPYSRADYVRLAARGLPVVQLETIDMAVIVRPTPVGQALDAAGAYPLAGARGLSSISDLRNELNEHGLVSLTWVQDPFVELPAGADEFDLNCAYKSHHVHDRDLGAPDYPGIHSRNIKRALKLCEVREILLSEHLDDWCRMYGTLMERHALGEAHAFDRDYFRGLASIEGFRTLGAFRQGELVSAHIWACAGDRVYSHLAASSPLGYKTGAAFAVNATALELFEKYRFISLGGVPDGGGGDGLERFKSGFTNSSIPTRLCGVIGNAQVYKELSQAAGAPDGAYFPAYRAHH